jgi:ABC-2 type transport system permease protein/lipopolysaccharide transport system permease protein
MSLVPPRPVVPDQPPADLWFKRRLHLVQSLGQAWRARELVLILTEREVRARYKQAVLGVAWAVLNPFLLMIVFTLFFDRVAEVDTGGVPYSLFSYVGLIAWTFFSQSVSTGGPLLVQERDLISKVAFPRESLPLSSIGVAAFHAAMSLPALAVLFVFEGQGPTATSYWVPLLLLVQVVFTAGVVTALSSTLVFLRDLRQALPSLLQVALFASPVAYGVDAIPESILKPYAVLNPLVGVIDGYRRTVLLGEAPDAELLLLGAAGAALWALLGYSLFKRLEGGFVDVA